MTEMSQGQGWREAADGRIRPPEAREAPGVEAETGPKAYLAEDSPLCPNGHRVSADDNFCTACGAEVADDVGLTYDLGGWPPATCTQLITALTNAGIGYQWHEGILTVDLDVRDIVEGAIDAFIDRFAPEAAGAPTGAEEGEAVPAG
jgi:hypothetical protein